MDRNVHDYIFIIIMSFMLFANIIGKIMLLSFIIIIKQIIILIILIIILLLISIIISIIYQYLN